MGSLFGGGGGAPKAVKPPKPLQLNLGQLEQQMVGADQAAYAQGDQYVNQYYPALAQARNNMIGQAYRALTGPLDPQLENAFVNQGNMASIESLGGGAQSGGDQSFGMGKGSLAQNAAAASVATNVQSYQDYNRALFEQLNTMYAPRSFGMTPQDAANVFTFNNTQYNNYLQQQFAAQEAAYYQQLGLGNAQAAAGTSAGAGIASALITGLAAY